MEILKNVFIILSVCLILFILVCFTIGAVTDVIKEIEEVKSRKKWAAEQEEGRYQRKIKLSCCKTCKRKKNHTDYFGRECFYNSEWSCEGPAAPERPCSVEIVCKPGVTQKQKEDAIKWIQKIIWDKYNDIPIKIELREETEDGL